jgi:pyruvate dehydrogenase E1 component
MNEKELREFRERFNIPISDDVIAETPFYRPPANSPETKYLLERRKELGGFLPERKITAERLDIPKLESFVEFFKGSGLMEVSTTMAFVRLLSTLLRNKAIGKQIVPIIPDEARTFGLDALFREIGIYSSKASFMSRWTSSRCSIITKRRMGRFSKKESPKPVPCLHSSRPARATRRTGST